ncbi:MAG TPA: response regulator [Polyangiaceae bacterium]|nr:response regulator [Polyangiaceae bacterium]
MSAAGKLLVIDDNQAFLDRIQARLQLEGYAVVTSSAPIRASTELPSCDLVILDFHMPGLNGSDALRWLRLAATRAGADPMFFLYTGDKVISHQYQDLGFDGGMINKGDDESLVQQVAVALRLAKLRRRVSKPPRHDESKPPR